MFLLHLWIEQILHNFEDQKMANFFNVEQVNFRVTLVIWLDTYSDEKSTSYCKIYLH